MGVDKWCKPGSLDQRQGFPVLQVLLVREPSRWYRDLLLEQWEEMSMWSCSSPTGSSL